MIPLQIGGSYYETLAVRTRTFADLNGYVVRRNPFGLGLSAFGSLAPHGSEVGGSP